MMIMHDASNIKHPTYVDAKMTILRFCYLKKRQQTVNDDSNIAYFVILSLKLGQ